ncbi:MAG: 50S ribosomal protein L29 [Bacteroidetes bacterium]|nr:50S ribosomal protein L29 [Bacteroidota bacterium]
MKNKDITGLTDQELTSKVNEEKASVARLKMSHAVSAIENPLQIRKQRKTVARLLTEVSKRKNANNK